MQAAWYFRMKAILQRQSLKFHQFERPLISKRGYIDLTSSLQPHHHLNSSTTTTVATTSRTQPCIQSRHGDPGSPAKPQSGSSRPRTADPRTPEPKLQLLLQPVPVNLAALRDLAHAARVQGIPTGPLSSRQCLPRPARHAE